MKKIRESKTPAPDIAVNAEDRLLDKTQLLTVVPYSFPTIWNWMRQDPPQFPRNRIVGQKSVWLASEVTAWMRSRPVAEYKKPGEPPEPAHAALAARARAGKDPNAMMAAKRKAVRS
jgi:predicted DNA-binding transcriptional regulator AlpA